MTVFHPEVTVVPGVISCDGTATVTISFDAAAALAADPADVILIMDRSSSMAPPRIDYAKAAANQFIDIFSKASGNTGGSSIANGSRMGIVSFSGSAREEVPLTAQITALHKAINDLAFGGSTNHEDAFLIAEKMLPPKDTKRQIVVMFTDGVSTAGGDADAVAQRIKNSGAEIYCIGLGANRSQIDAWASAPIDTHVTIDADPARLGQLFREIAAEVVLAGAQDVRIREQLNPDFRIVSVDAPTAGQVQRLSDQELVWTLDTVGLSQTPEKNSVSFDISHIAPVGGVKKISNALIYEDRAGNELVFPDPTLEVRCGSGINVLPEPCPMPTEFTVPGCRDALRIPLEDAHLTGLGRIIQVDVTIKNVCPGKAVAASIILNELAPDGTALPRGVKHLLIPAHAEDTCRDVTVKCIPFSLPEALSAAGNTASICGARRFAARVIANYTDTDFTCCSADSVTII